MNMGQPPPPGLRGVPSCAGSRPHQGVAQLALGPVLWAQSSCDPSPVPRGLPWAGTSCSRTARVSAASSGASLRLCPASALPRASAPTQPPSHRSTFDHQIQGSACGKGGSDQRGTGFNSSATSICVGEKSVNTLQDRRAEAEPRGDTSVTLGAGSAGPPPPWLL